MRTMMEFVTMQLTAQCTLQMVGVKDLADVLDIQQDSQADATE